MWGAVFFVIDADFNTENEYLLRFYKLPTWQTSSFDSYLWQTVEAKQKFIAQIMTSKSPVRSCEDVDETALSYAEIKALCAGNPLIAEKMNLDIDVARLRMLKADYQSQIYELEDDILKRYPKQIAETRERIAGLESDITLYEKHNSGSVNVEMNDGAASVTAKFVGMTIGNKTYAEKEPAAKALLEVCGMLKTADKTPIGNYMGFDMALQFNSNTSKFVLSLKAARTYTVELGTDAFGNITRINNALADISNTLPLVKESLKRVHEQVEAAKGELAKPFLLADELNEKELKLVEINTKLNIGNETAEVETVSEAEGVDVSDGDSKPKMSGGDFIKGVGEFNAGKRTDLMFDSADRDDDIAV